MVPSSSWCLCMFLVICLLQIVEGVLVGPRRAPILRHKDGDIFRIPKNNDDSCQDCVPESSSVCRCQCPKSRPVFREDIRECVSDVSECSTSDFVAIEETEKIPAVFLPLKDQLVHPQGHIKLPGMDSPDNSNFVFPVCVVTGDYYLTRNGWVPLGNQSTEDNIKKGTSNFKLHITAGNSYLKWVGSPNIRHSLEGRLVAVHLFCKDTMNQDRGIFTPCVVFRIIASPGAPEASFAAEGDYASSKSNKGGWGVANYAVLCLCVSLFLLLYMVITLVWTRIRRRAREQQMAKDDNDSPGSLPPICDRDVESATEIGESSNDNHSRPSDNTLSPKKLKRSQRIQNGYCNREIEDSPQSLPSSGSHTSRDSGRSNKSKTKKEPAWIPTESCWLDTEDENQATIETNVNTQGDEETGPHNIPINSGLISNSDECVPERTVPIEEGISLSDGSNEICDCGLQGCPGGGISNPIDGMIKKKLFFSLAFFDPDMLQSPPPAALDFLAKVREMIALAKTKLKVRKYEPCLSAIPEKEDLTEKLNGSFKTKDAITGEEDYTDSERLYDSVCSDDDTSPMSSFSTECGPRSGDYYYYNQHYNGPSSLPFHIGYPTRNNFVNKTNTMVSVNMKPSKTTYKTKPVPSKTSGYVSEIYVNERYTPEDIRSPSSASVVSIGNDSLNVPSLAPSLGSLTIPIEGNTTLACIIDEDFEPDTLERRDSMQSRPYTRETFVDSLERPLQTSALSHYSGRMQDDSLERSRHGARLWQIYQARITANSNRMALGYEEPHQQSPLYRTSTLPPIGSRGYGNNFNIIQRPNSTVPNEPPSPYAISSEMPYVRTPPEWKQVSPASSLKRRHSTTVVQIRPQTPSELNRFQSETDQMLLSQPSSCRSSFSSCVSSDNEGSSTLSGASIDSLGSSTTLPDDMDSIIDDDAVFNADDLPLKTHSLLSPRTTPSASILQRIEELERSVATGETNGISKGMQIALALRDKIKGDNEEGSEDKSSTGSFRWRLRRLVRGTNNTNNSKSEDTLGELPPSLLQPKHPSDSGYASSENIDSLKQTVHV